MVKKLVTELVTCISCEGTGIDGTLVCDNCGGEGKVPTGKMWLVEDYVSLNEGGKNGKG